MNLYTSFTLILICILQGTSANKSMRLSKSPKTSDLVWTQPHSKVNHLEFICPLASHSLYITSNLFQFQPQNHSDYEEFSSCLCQLKREVGLILYCVWKLSIYDKGVYLPYSAFAGDIITRNLRTSGKPCEEVSSIMYGMGSSGLLACQSLVCQIGKTHNLLVGSGVTRGKSICDSTLFDLAPIRLD